MNKLRLIKIYELRGKVHPMEEFIIELLDRIETYVNGNYVFYKKYNISYFRFSSKSNKICTYHILDDTFRDKFNSTPVERIEIMKYLLEKHLKLKIIEVR